MKYNKLVRDKIPEYLVGLGKVPKTHMADQSEYHQKLRDKLIEEVDEYLKSESLEELADVMEVVEALVLDSGFSLAELSATKKKKLDDRGAFTKRIILEEA